MALAVFIAGFAAGVRWLLPVLVESTGWPSIVLAFGLFAIWLALCLAVVWSTYDQGR